MHKTNRRAQKRPGKDEKVLEKKIQEIFKSYRLTGYLEYSIEKKISYKKVYKGRRRGVYL
ncbi:hypothetical protein C789_5102 [Microcystis aeruginosa FACHB-905 = DIANCHI905]|uniref:Uncharacterized protein n=1 Tax=Microcystis aeruginosa PCC 7806SL TaxID=1903187 RepID=A0AB33BTN6_MICA7|nr:hypothetical protein BH695_0566 [Microcystis aeruginosa PCC 7806SL]ELS45062.1 hypothetical protein C789_5102 [Microcystis aeruginosa FACHB-905 = DIANCHI905]TRU01322.1 MAG: hypothetical protein EWV61_12740 [Microcystis aeruginosa Ma_AC_P_19900807_S300]